MELIRQYFEKIVNLSEKDWSLFASKLSKQSFPKNHSLLAAGQTEQHLSFIETGIIRFYLPQKDHELTFNFAFKHSFVSGYDSLLKQQPSVYHMQTLSKTILWRISFSDLQHIYKETEVGHQIGRYAAENLFLEKSKRELSLLSETAEQRYLNLFVERPELMEKIPLKYIASYIGITPQALSRIRRRIS